MTNQSQKTVLTIVWRLSKVFYSQCQLVTVVVSELAPRRHTHHIAYTRPRSTAGTPAVLLLVAGSAMFASLCTSWSDFCERRAVPSHGDWSCRQN